mgnify:CR=1 FL=1
MFSIGPCVATPSTWDQGAAGGADCAPQLGSAQKIQADDSRAQSLVLTVRLGDSAGAVRTYEPAIDRYVAYRYEPDARARRLRLAFESNAPGSGEVKVLLPPSAGGLEGAWLDDRALTVAEEVVGTDRYLKLETDWKAHVLQVKWRP